MSELLSVLTWWVLVEILGIVAFPIAFRLFEPLADRGYGVSKALGLLLPSYLFWLLGILGFLRNDAGSLILSVIIVAVAGQLFYRYERVGAANTQGSQPRTTVLSWLRNNWKLVLALEIVFALSFGGWTLYRAHVSRILTAGGEKFMELAFLNGFGRSATLPPLDPWLAGYAISYYYFGYLIMSNLIRLSGVAASVGFNIGGALLFGLTVTGAMSLVYNLVASRIARAHSQPQGECESEPQGQDCPRFAVHRAPRSVHVWTAILGAVFVVLLSNLHGPLEVAHWRGIGSASFWRWLDIADLDQPPVRRIADSSSADRLVRPDIIPGGGWWWRASRVIFDYDLHDWPNRYNKDADPSPQRRENIDEFPFFSFLLGDMHPHVLALPFIMLALTVSLTLFYGNGTTALAWNSDALPQLGNAGHRRVKAMRRALRLPGIRRGHLFLFALIFGALGFLNTWDFPVHWVVAVGAYAACVLGTQSHDDQMDSLQRLGGVLGLAAVLGFGGLLLYAPFYVGLQSQAGGLLVHVHSSTRLAQFAVMFGPLLFILTSFLAWGVSRARARREFAARLALRTAGILLLLAFAVLVLTALAILVSPSIRHLIAPEMPDEEPLVLALRYLGMRLSVPWVTLLLVAFISTGMALLRARGFSRTVRFSLLLLIAGAGITLIPEYVYLKDVFGVRLNTIFKFYYQAWVLWAVAAAGAVHTLLISTDRLTVNYRRAFGVGLVMSVCLGLVYPLLAIPDRLSEFPESPTLDGTAYLSREQAPDYAAIQWLNTYVEDAPVILETPGGAYQYEGRVSAQTGLPTLVGWSGHEWQWRGNMVVQNQRLPVIEELYSTTDVERTLTLLQEYAISYVYVGPLERVKWPASGLEKFDTLMEIVYDRDGVRIYKQRDTAGRPIGE